MLSYFFGNKTEEPVEEDANPEIAMQNALDKHGEFHTSLQGTLLWDDFLALRSIITRYAWKAFLPEREKLLAKKMEIFKAQNQQEYVKIVKAGQMVLQSVQQKYTKLALEYIELSPENFNLSHKEHLEKDQEKVKKLQEIESKVRHELESRPVTEPKEEFVKIWKFKMQKELDMQRKMQKLSGALDPQNMQQVGAIEMNKIADYVLEEFGMDMTHLLDGVKHYDLLNDPEIASLTKIIKTQLQDDARKAIERASLTKEAADEMIKIAKEKGLDKPQIKSDKTMTFDYFLETNKLIWKYSELKMREGMKEYVAKRREALKEKKDKEYTAIVMDSAQWEQQVNGTTAQILYSALKVTRENYELSLRFYMLDPTKRAMIEEETNKVKESVREHEPKELNKEELLKATERLEQLKFEAQKTMYNLVRGKRIHQSMIDGVIRIEKMKADDTFFNEFGYEEFDVEPNVEKLKLEEDEDYKKICQDYADKSKQYLEERQDETAKMMKAQQEKVQALMAARKAKLEEEAKKKKEAEQTAEQKPEESKNE